MTSEITYRRNQHVLSQWVLRNFRSDDTATEKNIGNEYGATPFILVLTKKMKYESCHFQYLLSRSAKIALC